MNQMTNQYFLDMKKSQNLHVFKFHRDDQGPWSAIVGLLPSPSVKTSAIMFKTNRSELRSLKTANKG
jgi:hypothetical protein